MGRCLYCSILYCVVVSIDNITLYSFPIVNVSIQPVDCSTVAVDYSIQPLPGEDNAAQLDQFVLSYHKTTGSSTTIELSASLTKDTASGRVCVSNLERDTFYDFRYNVDVNLTGISVTPPGDFPRDITHRIPSNCSMSNISCKSECLSVCTCLICSICMWYLSM